jgi:hypothetical protein
VIRLALCAGLGALTLLVGLATAVVQSRNHERGQALNALKEECNMIEAVNGDRAERILAHDWAPLPVDRELLEKARSRRSARAEGTP